MDTSVASTSTTRARHSRAGLAAFVAGVAILIGSAGSGILDLLSGGSEAFEWIWVAMLVGFFALIFGGPGIHAYQAPADGAVGRWGAELIRYGGALLALLGVVFLIWEAVGDPPEQGPAVVDVAWMVGFAAFAIGVILLSVGIIRARVLPVASGALMLAGLVAAVAVDMATGAFFEDDATTTEWGFYLGVPVFAVGLAWAGYTVWQGTGRPRPTS